MRIFLIGFMGCGKTTLGARLASKLGYPFIDLDQLIEKKADMTIAEYFEKFGEPAFREFESQVLQSADYPADAVIATGGGAPCYFNNMEWMNREGITIYISLSPKALAGRLINGKEERPLIRGKSHEELIDFISAKLESREPYYSRAKFILNGIDITPEKVTQAIDLQ